MANFRYTIIVGAALIDLSPFGRWKRYRVLNLPALDENDESNFDYANGRGMSTEQYKQRRAAMEEAGQINSPDIARIITS